jgi:hypothetical protein
MTVILIVMPGIALLLLQRKNLNLVLMAAVIEHYYFVPQSEGSEWLEATF